MPIVAIHKNKRPIKLPTGDVVEPFTGFPVTASVAARYSRDRHFHTADEWRHLLKGLHKKQLQQMCKNAGVSDQGSDRELRRRLKSLLDSGYDGQESETAGATINHVLDLFGCPKASRDEFRAVTEKFAAGDISRGEALEALDGIGEPAAEGEPESDLSASERARTYLEDEDYNEGVKLLASEGMLDSRKKKDVFAGLATLAGVSDEAPVSKETKDNG